MSDFMQPEIYSGPYWELDTDRGIVFLPIDVCDPADLESPDESDDERIERLEREFADYLEWARLLTAERKDGCLGRLSAPGYLDCTDWSPYESPEAAERELREECGSEDESEALIEEDDTDTGLID